MAETDIYNSKKRYETVVRELDTILIPPQQRKTRYAKISKYYCKNKANLTHFKRMFNIFETKDQSYVRRLRICCVLRLITSATEKDLATIDKEGDRDEINSIVAFMHGHSNVSS